MIRAICLAVSLLAPSLASAMPRFAVQTGAPCSLCHVNPTGGGSRSAYGRGVFARQILQANLGAPRTGFPLIDPVIGDFVALGADVRAAYLHTIPRADVPEERARAAGLAEQSHTLFLMQADLYLHVDLAPYLEIYVDQGTYGSQEVYVRPRIGPLSLKAGKFMPAYGWRLVDHTTLVREPIGFGPRAKDTGLALVFDHPNLSAEVGMFNGAGPDMLLDTDRKRAWSGRLEGRLQLWKLRANLGVSGYWNESGEGDAALDSLRYGAFCGLGFGRLAYLAELDVVDDVEAGEQTLGYAAYHELSLIAVRGLQVAGTYEFRDPDTDLRADAFHRVGGSVQFFPWPNTELEVIARNTMANSNNPISRLLEVMVILHGYL
ncbi:MAG: hypothetical protein HYY06_30140 [Deltaproteobacteria bacterium]|nr:hypothetical protein [Deltaproteobacteria bacterium]